MPTSADSARTGPLLLDTSAAVALCVQQHDQHEVTLAALTGHELGLAGHAVFETYSVLTRLPGRIRLAPAAAARLLERNFPHTRLLSTQVALGLLAELADSGLAGGAVYDGLVAAAAREHDLPLVTRDRRALPTYRRLGVRLVQLDPPDGHPEPT